MKYGIWNMSVSAESSKYAEEQPQIAAIIISA